jgi:CBS domain-containing protein
MTPTIENYMATELVTFSPDDDIIQAMRVLLDKHLSGAPVVGEGGKLLGILSQKDCLAIVYNTAYHQDIGGKVGQYMQHKVEHLEADCSIFDAADHFLHSSYRRFPVLRGGELVGQISRHDIMRAIDEIYLR